MINYYKTLNISENALHKDIKKSFRKLAVLLHPDKNPDFNAKQKFIEIKKAYDVLSDPTEKIKYDRELLFYRISNLNETKINHVQQTVKASYIKSSIKTFFFRNAYAFIGIFIIIIFIVKVITEFFTNSSIPTQRSYYNDINTTINNEDIKHGEIDDREITNKLKDIKESHPETGELKF